MRTPTDVTRHPSFAGLAAALEPAQREAVLANDPVVCVLAGAGTGKTRVLTLRVARRVEDHSAHPSHVLVCTFSRKAADELRDRLYQLGVGHEVQAGTFHRTALRLIAQNRHQRGQPPPVIVADRRPLLADLLDGGDARRDRARGTRPRVARRAVQHRTDVNRLDAEIGWAKSRLVIPSGYEEAAQGARRRTSVPSGRVAEVYARYEEARRLRGVFDLDDLLWHCGDLLEENRAFARAVRWWHRHLFVDEMQDLNEAQYRLLRLLVGEEPDLFVVGDPNQSVYGWNGADPALLERATEEFAGTRVVRLHTNYRCAEPVVRVAAAVLGRDDPPQSARGEGPMPTIARLDNDAEEARWVARRAWLAHRPGRNWSSIAVLARTNAQLVLMAKAMESEHVPYRISGAELGPASDVRAVSEDTATSDEDASDLGGEEMIFDGADAVADEEPGEPDIPARALPFLHTDADAVVLSTFHRAKGLQWRTVFVVGASEGLVPLVTARSRAAKAEERRLFYVALTRAEEELTCSWAARPESATHHEDAAERRPSPWLDAVERVLDELRHGAAETSPARAAEHLAKMRDVLPWPSRPSEVDAR